MRRGVLSVVVVVICALAQAVAQKINIGYIYPAGTQRGSTLTIAIGGQSISTAKSVIVSGEGVSAEILPQTAADKKGNRRKKGAISDEDNLQLAQHIKVKITVAEDADLGIRDLRVVGATGIISNMLFFEIGEYRDFVESEPNNTIAEANHIEQLPVTVNGYVEKSRVSGDMEREGGTLSVERGGKDLFSFDAKAGECIVAEVKARRFVPYLADAVPGWFQSVISIYDEAGREVAYCDDYMLRVDPVITYKVGRTGRYYLKIHDSIYRGREDFVYRINLGVIPFVSSIYPLGGEASKRSPIEIRGVNIGGKRVDGSITEVLKTTINTAHLESGFNTLRYKNPKNKLLSNEFPYNISDTKINRTIADGVNNQGIKSAIPIAMEETINSRIAERGEEHWYYFDTKKRGNIIVKLTGRKLQSPIDAKIAIYDSKAGVIKVVDDTMDPSMGLLTHHADPEISFKIPSVGRYFVRVSDTQNGGGVEYAYQLQIKEYQPDFMLSIEPASLSIPQGGTSVITLFAQRKYNFKGVIDLKFEGLPEGYDVSATQYAGQAKSMKIAITAPKDAEVGRLDLKVLGISKIGNGEPVTKEAKPSQVMKQAFYIEHLISTDEFRTDITPADKFTMRIEPMQGDVIQLRSDREIPIRVVVERQEGFDDEIQIMKKMANQGIFFSSITIPQGESEGILYVKCPYWNPKVKSSRLMLLGTVKASTQNRVAGQARNTVNAAVMVNSPYVEVMNPTSGTPVSREELRRLMKLNK